MNYLFYLGHPAHYHLFKNSIKLLTNDNNKIWIIIKSKDVLKNLLDSEGIDYLDILPEGKNATKVGLFYSVLKRDSRLLGFCLKNKPDIMVGTSSEITHIGRLLNIPSFVFEEDDVNVIPTFARLTYPFASLIFAPNCCSVGKWTSKTIFYNSYHEIAYLHPKYFSPNANVLNKLKCFGNDYFLLRFVSLNANHDQGIKGIDDHIAAILIEILKPLGKIFITSERKLSAEFEQYRINLNPSEILDSLYFARLFIGDSQTMAAEAGLMGTPYIRFNDFVGRIGYLNELENKYQVGYGILPHEIDKLFSITKEISQADNIKDSWKIKSKKIINDKIDLTAFIVWFINNYPDSQKTLKNEPYYQNNFR